MRGGIRDGTTRVADDHLRSPKGWTGPKVVDGMQIEGTFRSHQVPVTDLQKARTPENP